MRIWTVMDDCIRSGVATSEKTLPGRLGLQRRAPMLYRRLMRGYAFIYLSSDIPRFLVSGFRVLGNLTNVTLKVLPWCCWTDHACYRRRCPGCRRARRTVRFRIGSAAGTGICEFGVVSWLGQQVKEGGCVSSDTSHRFA